MNWPYNAIMAIGILALVNVAGYFLARMKPAKWKAPKYPSDIAGRRTH